MNIRNFSPGDLNALMTIWLSANLSAHPFIPAAYWEDNFEAVREALPGAHLIVCEEEGAIAGFAGLMPNGYMAGLFVAEGYRGRGIGTALMAAAKASFAHITLQVYASNTAAVRFYLRQDFIQTGTRTDPATGQPEYTMAYTATEKEANPHG